ncbi:hypothetical protein [Asaia sp. As-1742]|uniref:hypothetical protein n=1 Tax=Asaia sp. As-1742 TaxID=2608325 RepID=UPI00196477AE|nr:hypothetical protein [Asaia sp. As-1742]
MHRVGFLRAHENNAPAPVVQSKGLDATAWPQACPLLGRAYELKNATRPRQRDPYGWTETHACAGHAVAIGQRGGCLQCHIGRTGTPELTAVDWPDGSDIAQEEPACGAHYQPYGPVELAYVNAMIAEVVLDCLLDPPAQSFSRVFVASLRRIMSLGGLLTEGWRSAFGEVEEGVRTADRAWPSASCAACGPERLTA